MKKLFLLFIFIVCFSSILINRSSAFNELSAELYVYASEIRSDAFTLNFLDSSTLQVVRSVDLTKPFPSDSIWGTSSPDGQYIAIVPSGTFQFSDSILLYNVLTDELRNIPVIISANFFRYSTGLLGKSSIVEWSPDSRKLAFISDDENGSHVGIYEIETEEITLFAESERLGSFANLAWASDSNQLAFATQHCMDICEIYIDMYSISQASLISSVKALDQHTTSGLLPEHICNLQWSPDSSYISFISVCSNDSIYWEETKEVYLLDIISNTISNITNLTPVALPMTNPPNDNIVGRFATYNTYWIDVTSFLIGATFSENQPSNQIIRTFDYDPSLENLVTVLDSRFVEFTSESSNSLRAVSLEDIDLTGTGVYVLEAPSVVPTTSQSAYPFGCNLDWSISGDTLAYTRRFNNICFSTVEALIFIDSASNTLREYSIGDQEIVPIGWILPN